LIEQLLSTFSVPSQAPSLGYNGIMTMGQASIVSVHGSIFEPLKLLNFNADLDPDFHSNSDQDPDPASKNNGYGYKP
jgi:hypothetical protein